MTGDTPWDDTEARAVIAAKSAEPGAAMPILHALQDRFGYIDDTAVPMMAEALNLTRAEVLGVISFYHEFRRQPVEGRVLKLCRAESCQAVGCEDLVEHLSHAHGIEVGHAKGRAPLHVEPIYCLGDCALSPAALLDGEPIGRLDRDRLDAIVANAGKKQS